jgi:hypothetical protein
MRQRQTRPATVSEITEDIIQYLSPHFYMQNIRYVAPYFIITLRTASSQKHLLSLRVLCTARFNIDVLPWCPEYETTKLPWMVPRDPFGKYFKDFHYSHIFKINWDIKYSISLANFIDTAIFISLHI